jgi:hypothetical protein
MDGKMEQGVCIKCCVKIGKCAAETLQMLYEAELPLSRTAVFEWESRFKTSRVSIEGDERSGRTRNSKMKQNVEGIRELIHEDSRRTIHELADTVGISYLNCQGCLELR